jgi:adenine phosphoribosyltransferase
MDHIKSAIRTIPDYPKPGIMFRDVTTLLGDAGAFRAAVDAMVFPHAGKKIDKVAGIEARGFIWAARWRTSSASASCRSARRASCPIPR